MSSCFIWSTTLLHIHPAPHSHTWEVPSIATAVCCWLHWSSRELSAMLKGTLSPVVVDRVIKLYSVVCISTNALPEINLCTSFGITSLLDCSIKDTRGGSCALISPSVLPRWSRKGWCVYPHGLDWHILAVTRQYCVMRFWLGFIYLAPLWGEERQM